MVVERGPSANPIGIVVLAIAALVAALIYAWNNSETFRSIVMGAWEAVKVGISAAVDWIIGAVQWFGQLPAMVGGWFASMAQSAIGKATELVEWIRGLPGRILGALGNLGGMLLGAGMSIINGFLNGLKSAFESVKNFVSGIGSWIAAHKGPISYDVKLLVPAGGAIMDGLLGGLQDAYVPVRAFVSGVAGDLRNTVDSADASRMVTGAPASGSVATRQPEVRFTGNTSDALASVIMQMFRTGQIQVVT